MKKVIKKSPNGRCYNEVNGQGWEHYTKGHRKYTTKVETYGNGFLKMMSVLERAMPKKEVSENKVKEALDKIVDNRG